jgi:uncharacterized RDD family membrane protein YckC
MATLIDTVFLAIIIVPAVTLIYGSDYWTDAAGVRGFWDAILNYLLPFIAVIIFWQYKSATPGKMLLHLTIVDARTGEKPSPGQLVGRYFAYYVSALPLLLGFIWVAVDGRKQGWHDKLAGTVVVKNKAS